MPASREERLLRQSGFDPARRHQVIEAVRACLALAANGLRRELPLPEIRFDLGGASAGQFVHRRALGLPFGRMRNHYALRFNPHLFERHFDDNLLHTVPHEVAHYLVALCHPRRRCKPHGAEWRRMMDLLGVEARRTHDYPLAGLPLRRQRRWTYRCACREHALSTTRHHRAQQGTDYRCRSCGGELHWMQEETSRSGD